MEEEPLTHYLFRECDGVREPSSDDRVEERAPFVTTSDVAYGHAPVASVGSWVNVALKHHWLNGVKTLPLVACQAYKWRKPESDQREKTRAVNKWQVIRLDHD